VGRELNTLPIEKYGFEEKDIMELKLEHALDILIV